MHPFRFVDRPDMDLQPARVRRADEAPVHDREPDWLSGHLRADRRPPRSAAGIPYERSRRPSTPRTPYEVARRGTREALGAGHACLRERAHADPVPGVGPRDQVEERDAGRAPP